MTNNGRMKTVTLIQEDLQESHDSTAMPQIDAEFGNVDRHTAQLADLWNVTTRAVNKWIAQVREAGYSLGEEREKNRIYYSPDEQQLIKMARYGTLPRQQNINPPRHQSQPRDPSRDESVATEGKIVHGQSHLVNKRLNKAEHEGVALAKAETKAKWNAYLKARQVCDELFDQAVEELDNQTIEVSAVEIDRSALRGELF